MRLIRLLKKDLAREIADWVDKDLMTREQAQSICSLYDIDYDNLDSRSIGYRLLIALGYLFIGLALITLIGANWSDIPRAVRMAGLLALTLATHGIGIHAWLLGNQQGAAGFFLLGNLFYGASIILIAQIYHLGEHMPDGVYWWALGSLPFGLLLQNSWLMLFSCLLALLWFFLEFSLGFFPATLPLFLAAGIYVLVKGRSSILLFLTVVAGIGFWVEALLSVLWADSRYHLNIHPEHFFVSIALFLLAYATSLWLANQPGIKAKDYGAVLLVWCLRFGLILLFVLSYGFAWEELIESHWQHAPSMWAITLAICGASLWLGYKSNKTTTLAGITAFALLSMLLLSVTRDPAMAVYYQVVYNIALVCSGVWLIVRGINAGVSHYFFAGLATILLTAFLRYIDLIGEYVGGAALFMVMAAILLGAAKYWKHQQTREAGA